MVASSWLSALLVRAFVSGFVFVQCSSSAAFTASSTFLSPASMRPMSARGTLPASSHRSRTDCSAFFAAARSRMGRICWASFRRASLTVRLPAYSSSTASFAALRASKKRSWAARKRAQRASSSLRLARFDDFHSSMRWRYSAAVCPQSVDPESCSARRMSASLACFASALSLSSWEK
jgi:hypothetical protein